MAVLVLDGPIARADISGICERAYELLVDCGEPIVCDVGRLETDAVTVEALARLQLTARRLGRRIVFRGARGDLQGLLALMGLSDVLPCGPASGLEARRQPEEREQARRVEEEGDPGDASA